MNKTNREHNDYDLAVDAFEALRAVIRKVTEENVFIRSGQTVTRDIRDELPFTARNICTNHDRAVCGLVNKAANTHAAVRLLTDAGHGDDAMALGRVLFENAMLLRWLLIDPVYRLDLYCISADLYRRRWSELALKHYQHDPQIVASAKEAASDSSISVAAFFGNTIRRWAQVLHPNGKHHRVNFEEMLKEIAEHDGSTSTFQQEVVYFLHSAYVHSTAHSMKSFATLDSEQHFRFDLGPNGRHCDTALDGANMAVFIALQSRIVVVRGRSLIRCGVTARIRRTLRRGRRAPQNNCPRASRGVMAGIGERAKCLTFLVTMCDAPHARAAATCIASSKSAIGSERA